MKRGRKQDKKRLAEQPFDPYDYPLSELLNIQRRKVKDLDLRVEPKVSVSWSESDELQPLVAGDYQRNFSHSLTKNAERCGFKWFRPVQEAILPYMNEGSNICLGTGGCSGKTVGYIIPLIQKVLEDLEKSPHKPCHPRAVIVASTREKGIEIFNLLRMLTEGLGINIALSMKGIDPEIQYTNRDKADIIVISHRALSLTLEEERFTFASLKFLVLESIDDVHSDTGNEILKHYDAFSAGSQLITVLEDISALQTRFCQDRVLNGENTVIIENGINQRLSPSNHALLRVNNKTMLPALMELIQNYEQGKVIIVVDGREPKSLESSVKEALDKAGITHVYHHPLFDVARRAEIQHRFAKEEYQVLMVPYCNQMRAFRFPGVKQIIHLGPPANDEEKRESSYNYSSSCVAFNREARSVILFNVENKFHKVKKIAETIGNCPVIENWPRNRVPQWATDFVRGKKAWTEEDVQAAEEMWDLEEAAQIPSKDFYEAEDYIDEKIGEQEQNWDSGANPKNMMKRNSSSASPSPIGDVYTAGRNNGGSQWHDDRRAPNPSRNSRKGNSRFEEQNEGCEYDEFEKQNIGKMDFTNSRRGMSRSRGNNRTTSSPASYHDHQGPYFQGDYDDRQDNRRQEHNDWRPQSGYSAQGTSREFQYDKGRQNRSYQGHSSFHQMSQKTAWDAPQMGPCQGSFDDRMEMDRHQNWPMDRRQPNRQIQEQNHQMEFHSKNDSRDKLGWNGPQEYGNDRQADRHQDFRRGGQPESRSKRASGDRPERYDRWGPQEHQERQYPDERRGSRISDNRGGRRPRGSDDTGGWTSQGNDRVPRNRFSQQYREWEKTHGFSSGPRGKDEPTGSWDTVEGRKTSDGGASDFEY